RTFPRAARSPAALQIQNGGASGGEFWAAGSWARRVAILGARSDAVKEGWGFGGQAAQAWTSPVPAAVSFASASVLVARSKRQTQFRRAVARPLPTSTT